MDLALPPKSILSSLTFWGSLLAFVGALFPQVFVYLGHDPASSASWIVSAVGFVIAVIGRIRANQPVTLTGSK